VAVVACAAPSGAASAAENAKVFRSTRQRGARSVRSFSITCVPFNDIVKPEGIAGRHRAFCCHAYRTPSNRRAYVSPAAPLSGGAPTSPSCDGLLSLRGTFYRAGSVVTPSAMGAQLIVCLQAFQMSRQSDVRNRRQSRNAHAIFFTEFNFLRAEPGNFTEYKFRARGQRGASARKAHRSSVWRRPRGPPFRAPRRPARPVRSGARLPRPAASRS
jgi:hypothetical protein